MQRKLAEQQREGRHEATTRASGQSPKLAERYGKIGISAVAAAVRCRAGERKSSHARYTPQDCD